MALQPIKPGSQSDIFSAEDLYPVEPSDTDDLPFVARAIRAQNGGDLRITSGVGLVRDTFIGDGELLPVVALRVHLAGTTASGIEAVGWNGIYGDGTGGGPTQAVNIAPPSLTANGYAGGPYTAYPGVWMGATSTVMTLQSSADGLVWVDEGALPASGDWSASLAGRYVRPVETAQPGSVASYGVTFGPLGPAYDYILNFAGDNNRLDHTVVSPFVGASLTAATTGASSPGLWLSALWYFNGTGLEGNAAIVSLGNSASTQNNLDIRANSATYRSTNVVGAAVSDVVSAAGWYLTTGWFSQSGSNRQVTAYVNEGQAESGLVAGANAISNLVTLRMGDTANSTIGPTTNFDQSVAYVAFGRGNPIDAHAWAYNEGIFRRIDGYDFVSDLKCTIEGMILTTRVGAATFNVSEIVDSIGSFDNWTLTGSLAWGARKPGFIYPAGDPPPLPNTYISPRFGNPGDTFTLCAQTIKIGQAIPSDFTINSLVHSTLGNIAGTVSGGQFVCNTAGTIAFNITHATRGNATGTIEVVPAVPMVANPQFASRYNEGARVAQIEEYVSPGAGTTYANAAALATAINGLASGATLIVNDLTDLANELELVTSGKDYGGATVVATNRHGVAVKSVYLKGAKNLTLRGFRVVDNFHSVTPTNVVIPVDGVTLDHCTGKYISLKGGTGITSTLTISNWIGPDDGTALKLTIGSFNRVTLRRVAHANLHPTGEDVIRTDLCNILIADRFYFGDTHTPTNPDTHGDCWQAYGTGTQGYNSGLIQNGMLHDIRDPDTEPSQGLFLAGPPCMGMMVRNIVSVASLPRAINVANALQDVRIENTTSYGRNSIDMGYSACAAAKNNAQTPPQTVLANTTLGTETGTVQVTESLYPSLNSGSGWRRFASPTTPGVGADGMVAALLIQSP